MENSLDFKDIWQEMLEFLQQDPEVGAVKVNLWLRQVVPVSFENNVFTLRIPNSMIRHTIQTKFERKIIDFLKNILCIKEEISAVYIIAEDENGAENTVTSSNDVQPVKQSIPADPANISSRSSATFSGTDNNNIQQPQAAQHLQQQTNRQENILTASWQPSIDRLRAEESAAAKAAPAVPDTNLFHPMFDPAYTFENFITGTSNRFAYSAAQALVTNNQSPLFIYSAPGLGKTHLLNAIAHGLYRLNPKVKVLLSSAETFVNEYIRDVGNRKAEAFREKYRMLDCLLLDDVQFLLAKEKSVEEFFYTFNSLFNSKKRIVITSDRHPQELNLWDRLTSRFMSGIVADIRLPDYETRVAILNQKIEQGKFDIPIDIVNFIAEKVHKGGRELEGCIRTVHNFCMQTGARATIDSVQELLRPFFSSPASDQPISIKTIIKVVSDYYKVDEKDILSSRRDNTLVLPRHVAMYLSIKLTNMTLEKISEAFGRKSHATVLHAKEKMENEEKNIYVRDYLNKIIQKIKDVNNPEDLN